MPLVSYPGHQGPCCKTEKKAFTKKINKLTQKEESYSQRESGTSLTGLEKGFVGFFPRLLIVSLLLVPGDKANKEQYLPLFSNIVTFKQGKCKLSK